MTKFSKRNNPNNLSSQCGENEKHLFVTSSTMIPFVFAYGHSSEEEECFHASHHVQIDSSTSTKDYLTHPILLKQ